MLFYRGKLWVPEKLRLQIIAASHCSPPFLHPGQKKTTTMILKVFNWPNLHQEVAIYLKSCLICQQLRSGPDLLKHGVKTHLPTAPFSRIYMDLWSVDFERKKRTVLTMVDNATRWAEAVYLEEETSFAVTKAFLKVWICRYGVPTTIVSDNGSVFVAEVFEQLCNRIGITHLKSTTYHPKGNALVEKFHQSLKKGLMCLNLTSAVRLDFDELLQITMYAYRSAVHLGQPFWLLELIRDHLRILIGDYYVKEVIKNVLKRCRLSDFKW